MFLAAAFGMMALLSLPLSLPDLSVLIPPVVVPPVVKVPVPSRDDPSASGGSAMWGRPGLAALAASYPAIPFVQRTTTGTGLGEGQGGPPGGGGPQPPHSPRDHFRRKVLSKTSHRIKALVRHGHLDAEHVLARARYTFQRRQGPVGWGHASGHGHWATGQRGRHGHGHPSGHGHDQGHHSHAWHGAR